MSMSFVYLPPTKLIEDEGDHTGISGITLFAWINPGHREDSSIYANKGSASTWHNCETTTKTAETACFMNYPNRD